MTDYMEVPLSQGLVALVDADDYPAVMRHKWCAIRSGAGIYYAKRNLRISRTGHSWQGVLRMHRFLTGWRMVDHINGDGLDNRMANLREATYAQNNTNRRPRGGNTNGFKGVHRSNSARNPWRAQVAIEGRKRHLGVFRDRESAARAYDAAAVDAFGDFAWLNFPTEHGR
jgi:hypothetical protein